MYKVSLTFFKANNTVTVAVPKDLSCRLVNLNASSIFQSDYENRLKYFYHLQHSVKKFLLFKV